MSEEMTRKEVIWQLKGLLLGELRTTTKERKALEYAISSLETDEAYQLEYERTTKNDLAVSSGLEKNSKKLEKNFGESDCISRSDVLKLMQDNWHTHNGDWAMQESMDDIRALPAVALIRPKGHWIDDADKIDRKFGRHDYYCSECNVNAHDFICVTEDCWDVDKPNYCPNCGSDNREVEESEDKE